MAQIVGEMAETVIEITVFLNFSTSLCFKSNRSLVGVCKIQRAWRGRWECWRASLKSRVPKLPLPPECLHCHLNKEGFSTRVICLASMTSRGREYPQNQWFLKCQLFLLPWNLQSAGQKTNLIVPCGGGRALAGIIHTRVPMAAFHSNGSIQPL